MKFPALAAWRRRGDYRTTDQLWRCACWEAGAQALAVQGCLERARNQAAVARVIAIDAEYFPGDEEDARNGGPGAMERRGRLTKAQFRALMREAMEERDKASARSIAPIGLIPRKAPADGWPRAKRAAWA